MSRRRREYLKHEKVVEEFLGLLQEVLEIIEPEQNSELTERIERKINEYRREETKSPRVEDNGKLQNI